MKIKSYKTFLNYSLLACMLSLSFYACQNDTREEISLGVIQTVYDADSLEPLVVFLVDKTDKESVNYNNELRKTINYTKIPYQQLDIATFNKNAQLPKSTKVVVIRDTKKLSKLAMQSLITFVNNGQTIFFPNASEDEKFGFFMGIKPNSEYIVNTNAKGFSFKVPFIPEFKNKSYYNDIIHYGLSRENFTSKIEILATAENDDNFPTIIKHKFGKGFALAFNTTQYAQKQDRGLLFAGVLAGLSQIPYPVANVSTIFLDDFPAPLYPGIQEPIKSELNLSQSDFYRKIWWPDMLKLAKTYRLTYTAIPCFDYRGKTEPPFLFPEWDASLETYKLKQRNASDWLMTAVTSNGFEMGFHGYNHESLVKKDWENPDFMVTSLNAAIKRWNSLNYGALPQTYVPPSNHIDQTGIKSLVEGLPSVTTMSSVYLGEFLEGGNREFDPEPYNNLLFNFPRNTSGYDINNQAQFDHQSLFIYTGIWSHFVHPDDVYQIPADNTQDSRGDFDYRNPNAYGWRTSKNGKLGLFPRFENYIKAFQNQYPLTPSLSTIDAVKRTKNWRNATYNINLAEKQFSLNTQESSKRYYWMMYVKASKLNETLALLKAKNLNYSKTSILNGALVMVETKTPQITLKKQKETIEETARELEVTAENQLKNYANFIGGNPYFETLEEEIDYAIKNNQLDDAILLLEKKLSHQQPPNLKDLKQLETYYNWNEKPQASWRFLDQLFSKKASKHLIDYSIVLSKSNDYPDAETRKKWLLRQIAQYPNDTALKIAYNDYFSDESEITLTLSELWVMFENSKNPNEKAQYLVELIEKDHDNAITYISNLKPCDDGFAKSIFTEIAYALADAKAFKDALLWAKCTTDISNDALIEWTINTEDIEALKTLDYTAYLNYLLEQNPQKAISELESIAPCSLNGLQTDNVAYAYGNANFYRKALAWSNCNKEFPIVDQLQWLAELKDYDKVIETYQQYIKTHPDDDAVSIFMTDFYIGQSLTKDAFATATTLKVKTSKDLVKPALNDNLIYANLEDKRFIIKTYPDLILDSTLASIEKELRLNAGHYIESNSQLVTDRLDPTALGNQLSYHFYNAKLAKHHFGVNQYNAYAINTNELNPDNRNHNLYGLHYGYAFKERANQFNLSSKALLELDTENKLFYNLNVRATKSKDSLFSSIALSYRPAITGPAYSLNNYRAQLEVYEEYQFNPKFTGILALEGNYYTDKVLDGLIVSKLIYNYKFKSFDSFNPYTEIAGMLGNTNRINGYPYWTIKERLYGGVGLGYMHNNPNTKLEYGANFGGFLDTFSDSFLRYGGQVNYPISDYFKVNANAEFYTLKNFYSNNFSFGLTYYLK
jgi:hypothetical protein